MISVIILTLNEQEDLPGCLDSIKWADDIHVVDSGSTDKTLDIAKDINAKTYHDKFTGFGNQRNWSLRNCSLKYDWILFLDADERSTSAFKDSMISSINSVSLETIGFYLCFKTILNGMWLRYSDNFPKWQFRLVKKDKGFFINAGHGQKESGNIKHIDEPYIHLAFSKGWEYWHEKHKQYAIKDAKQVLDNTISPLSIFSTSGSQRNFAIKAYVRRLPLWPYVRFLLTFLYKKVFWMVGMGSFIAEKYYGMKKELTRK